MTYTVSTTSVNNVLILGQVSSFTYQGGTNDFTVTSYKWTGDGNQTPVTWSASFSNNTDTQNSSWITLSKVSSSSNGTVTIYRATCKAQTATNITHTNLLQNATLSEQPYDLSKHDHNGIATKMNTANCYIVNAPGIYKLPLVYGNAIVNGSSNSSAWKSTKTGADVLTTFVDHKDAAISSPYIYNKYTPTSAALIWQDQNGVIIPTSLKLTDQVNGKYTYLQFEVDKSKINECNAIVAVLGSDGIMWSWHIWITDMDVYSVVPLTNYDGAIHYVMPFFLGWCAVDNASTKYASRSVKMTLTQNGGTSTNATLYQNEKYVSASVLGSCPFYQWGRKDPIPGAASNGSEEEKVVYYPNSKYTFAKASGPVSIGQGIQHPYIFYRNAKADWCSTSGWKNRWNANSNSVTPVVENVVKTIYDPCPVGFHMPSTLTFTGFSDTGKNIFDNTNIDNLRNGDSSWDYGRYFYTQPKRKGSKYYMPCNSYRDPTNGDVGAFRNCYSWLPTVYSRTNAYFVGTYDNTWQTLKVYGDPENGNGTLAFALAIIPEYSGN